MYSSNAALAKRVAEYAGQKQKLEDKMRQRRKLYEDLFGEPLKPSPPAARKGRLGRVTSRHVTPAVMGCLRIGGYFDGGSIVIDFCCL